MKCSDFLNCVSVELERAAKHGPMNSDHEAYAVILEEVEEYWLQVMKKKEQRNCDAMRDELIQIAAMCAKAARDLH